MNICHHCLVCVVLEDKGCLECHQVNQMVKVGSLSVVAEQS